MQTDTQMNGQYVGTTQYQRVLDLEDYVRCVKKYWIQFLLLVVIATGVTLVFLNYRYQPNYTAKITYAVNKTENIEIDAALAKRLSSSVSSLTNIKEFEDILAGASQDAKKDYKIASSFTENSNLFLVTVTSNTAERSNAVLDVFEMVYPEWASKSSGTLDLQLVDKSLSGGIPMNPYSMIKNIVIGILVGIVICLGFATLYVATVKTVRKESDMQKITNKSCISLIPEINVKARSKSTKAQLLITNKKIDWGFKQSVLAAQTRIQKQMDSAGQKVLLVSSTIPQEGKSVMAVNLALAFAQREKNVLLIDGDLRKPSVGPMLGEAEGKGLTECLEGKGNLEDYLVNVGGLTLLRAGEKHGGVSSMVDERRMELLMNALRERFDYIVIDTPPSGLFADASILSTYADAVLYVVRCDKADMNEIRKGLAPFQKSEKLLGYLINRDHGGFSSYGKYGYGYGYGKYGKYGKYKRYTDLDEKAMNTEDTL